MKAILMPIHPKPTAKILSGDKIAEVRRNAPREWIRYLHGKGPKPKPCEVYIYCTKNKLHYSVGALVFNKDDCFKRSVDGTYKYGDSVELMGYSPDYPYDKNNFLNGKVVAKFMLREVEEIICRPICGEWESYTKALGYSEISQAGCLENREIVHYLKGNNGYAWHISDLQIFDEPMELSEFHTKKVFWNPNDVDRCVVIENQVTRPPRNWKYIEVEQ